MGTPRTGAFVLLFVLTAGCGRDDEYPPIDPVPTVRSDPQPLRPGHDAASEATEGIDLLPPAMGLPTTPVPLSDETAPPR